MGCDLEIELVPVSAWFTTTYDPTFSEVDLGIVVRQDVLLQ
ncbi:hypothetical protein SP41_110 [Salmonella phage 41]|nr:hypothetical protein SP41_110 [Salmonella phage 41]